MKPFAFVGEWPDRLFDAAAAASAGVPDELAIASEGHTLRIAGEKKSDTATILGKTTGHFGKIGAISLRPGAEGTITVKVSTADDQTYYHMMLIDKNGMAKDSNLPLQAGQKYTWRLEQAGDNFGLRVFQNDKQIGEVLMARRDFAGVGFGATVRHPHEHADLTVTYR